MKTIQTVLILFCIAGLSAKEIVVKGTAPLFPLEQQSAYFPNYSLDGNFIYFTDQAYRGLWKYNRSTQTTQQISDVQGAGFQPLSLPDGSVIFRQDSFQRRRKYTALLHASGQTIKPILEPSRFLSPAVFSDHQLIALRENTPIFFNENGVRQAQNQGSVLTLISDNASLKLLLNGELQTLEPLGSRDYIWGQISPEKDRLVFTCIGVGTYICNLQGKHLVQIGTAHAPQWSPDGQFLVYMKDLDDGEQFTASEIWIGSVDGTRSWKITDTPDRIEMYPQWSPDNKHITYHSLQGEIFETTIEIVN